MTNGVIYKIEINENNIYVGSTERILCKRQSQHNHDLKKYPERKLYKLCIENNITKIKCIWVADVEFNSKAELRMVEEEYRKKLNGNLNSQRCYTTEEEKKEYQKETQKEYRNENKEKMKEYQKEYRNENKEKYKEYRNENKEKIEEYQKKYKNENKEKSKEYYQNNKKKLNEKVKCDLCGSMINSQYLKQHKTTQKCKLLY